MYADSNLPSQPAVSPCPPLLRSASEPHGDSQVPSSRLSVVLWVPIPRLLSGSLEVGRLRVFRDGQYAKLTSVLGGFSNLFPRPKYQDAAVTGYLGAIGNSNAGLFK